MMIIEYKFQSKESGVLFDKLHKFHCIRQRFCHLDGAQRLTPEQ